jgi:hypothetical protein
MEKTKEQFQEEYFGWGKIGLLDELWTKEQSLINLEMNYEELKIAYNRLEERSSNFVQVDDSEEKIHKLEEALQKAELEAFRYKQSLQTVLELLKS